MTGFHYRYVGVIGVGDRGKKAEKKRVSFAVSASLGNRNTDLKKSVCGREKTKKNRPKKTTLGFRFKTVNPEFFTHQNVFSTQPRAQQKNATREIKSYEKKNPLRIKKQKDTIAVAKTSDSW